MERKHPQEETSKRGGEIWTPKSGATGPAPQIAKESTNDDAAVCACGDGGIFLIEEATQLAVHRASVLQEELDVSPPTIPQAFESNPKRARGNNRISLYSLPTR